MLIKYVNLESKLPDHHVNGEHVVIIKDWSRDPVSMHVV